MFVGVCFTAEAVDVTSQNSSRSQAAHQDDLPPVARLKETDGTLAATWLQHIWLGGQLLEHQQGARMNDHLKPDDMNRQIECRISQQWNQRCGQHQREVNQ